MNFLLFNILCALFVNAVKGFNKPSLSLAIESACDGDLSLAVRMSKVLKPDAGALHIISAASLILDSNYREAVKFHKEAKGVNSSRIPPLAELNLNGRICGGLADLFYVAAVIIKELVDTESSKDALVRGITSLVTLTADSGLPHAAEEHIKHLLGKSIISLEDC